MSQTPPTSNELIASLRDGDSKFRIAAPRSYDGTLARAADEIERLTRDRDEIAANRHADACQWREAIAERDRLRAALELRETGLRLIAAGPPITMANDGVAAWAAFVAQEALSGEHSVPETSGNPTPHGIIYDRPGWLCSICGGWNHLRDSHCTHTHAVQSAEKASSEPSSGSECPACGVMYVAGARHFSGCPLHPGESVQNGNERYS